MTLSPFFHDQSGIISLLETWDIQKRRTEKMNIQISIICCMWDPKKSNLEMQKIEWWRQLVRGLGEAVKGHRRSKFSVLGTRTLLRE